LQVTRGEHQRHVNKKWNIHNFPWKEDGLLQSVVSQQMLGATDLRSPTEYLVEKDLRRSREDSSFGEALEKKMSLQGSKNEDRKTSQDDLRTERKTKEARELKDSKDSKDTDRPNENAEIRDKVRKAQDKTAKGRSKAIKEFMDSFESEFQIPPTRLVEAMAQLSDKELVQAPEKTVDSVVSKLGLEDSESEKAAAMYAGLLAQLSQIQQQVPSVPEVALNQGNPQQLMPERMAFAQLQQAAQTSSIEDLNNKFWNQQNMNDSLANSESAGTEMAQLADQKSSIDELPPHLQGQMKESVSPSLLAALAAKKAAMNREGEMPEMSQEKVSLRDEFQQAIQSQGSQASSSKAQDQMNQGFQNQSSSENLMQQNLQNAGFRESLGVDEAATTTGEKLEFQQTLTGAEGLMATPVKGESLNTNFFVNPTAGPNQPNQGSAEQDVNIKEIMNRAQYLVQKGGGELKLKMNPEGLGNIDLKVMLQDGKLNLHMSADTPEAKKVLESSLADLKTSLAAHKLSVENVKVDVVNSTSTDTATQNQTNFNGQNGKDQRQFWNQFNENFGSQGRRESLMEMPNLKGYGSRERSPLNPIETSSDPRARKVEGKGRGLNLVA
jgi:flagellar hook-length control protein FliK